jgi:hypothetical protein
MGIDIHNLAGSKVLDIPAVLAVAAAGTRKTAAAEDKIKQIPANLRLIHLRMAIQIRIQKNVDLAVGKGFYNA